MIKMTAVVAGSKLAGQLKAVQKSWEAALKEEGKEIRKLYRQTTKTWTHVIAFNTEFKKTKRQMYTTVWTVNKPYWFVHEGIKTMYAVLSSDWQAKTEPGILKSGPGRGQVVKIDTSRPRPLYKAREFTEEIIKVRQPKFQKRMVEATRDGVANALRGG
jgi:hypothetical protein